MRKTLLGLLFLCLVSQQNLPAFNYVPQAPTKAAFTRYGDIPVDLSTGVTNISIPIYTLSENGMNVPISISYHASGIKVSDVASVVGLGWTLNAGGTITRTTFGLKDEYVDYGNGMRQNWNLQRNLNSIILPVKLRGPYVWWRELYDYYLFNRDNYSDRCTLSDKPGGFDSETANHKVSVLNGITGENRVGPGVILKVMAGDKITASTFAWYQPTGMDNSTQPGLMAIVENLLGQLVPGISAAKGVATGQITNSILQPGMENFLTTQSPEANAPRAYLNWVLLDEKQFKMVAGGVTPVPVITGAEQKQLLEAMAAMK